MSGRIQNGFTDEIPEACTRDSDELAPPTPDTSTELSADRLAEIRETMFHWARDDHPMALLSREIMASYDVLTARVAELESRAEKAEVEIGDLAPKLVDLEWDYKELERELAAARAPVSGLEILRLREWLMAPLFEGEDAPPEHMQAAQVITRLSRERGEARAKALEEAAAIFDKMKDTVTPAKRVTDDDGFTYTIGPITSLVLRRPADVAATIRALKEKAYDADA